MHWAKRFFVGGCALVFATFFFLGGHLWRETVGPGATSKQIDELEAQGELILDQISAFRYRYQRVPESFDDAGLSPTRTMWGKWSYSKRSEECFEISIGDYTRNEFELSWDSCRGEWYRDT